MSSAKIPVTSNWTTCIRPGKLMQGAGAGSVDIRFSSYRRSQVVLSSPRPVVSRQLVACLVSQTVNNPINHR